MDLVHERLARAIARGIQVIDLGDSDYAAPYGDTDVSAGAGYQGAGTGQTGMYPDTGMASPGQYPTSGTAVPEQPGATGTAYPERNADDDEPYYPPR